MTSEPTALLDDLRWLRTLAGRLTRDPHLADDVVQDAAVQALAQSTPPRQPRAWLMAVVQNLLFGHHRAERARQRRETAHGPGGAPDDGQTLLQRAETQHRLAAAVLQLDEPYRSAVLLRFFDGLPPRRIAKKLGVPVATVHSRLQRALQQLRGVLDRQPGGRAQWLTALAPFALPAPILPLPGLGLLLMQANLKLLAALAVVVCSVPFWWPSAAASEDAALPEAKAPVADASGRSGRSGGAPARSGEAPERRSAALGTNEPRPPAPRFPVAGRVCDCAGAGVADVLLAPDGRSELAVRSDASGNFHFELEGTAASIAAADERYVTVLGASWAKDARFAPVVVVARAVRVGGRVVDATNTAIAGAQLLLQLPADFETRFPLPLDRAERRRWNATSAADGAFGLGRLPRIDGATLFCAADAYAPVTLPLPEADDPNLQVVLQRFRYDAGELLGRVVDPGGAPVAGARVAMGVTSVVTDGDGRFGLSLRRAGWPTAVVAAKAGFRPTRCEVPTNGGKRREDWPDELVLRLGPAPQSVRGRVVDQDKKGIAGAEVWISDPTPFGIAGLLPLQIEYFIAGGAVPRQAARMKVPFADDPTTDGNVTGQAGNVTEPTASWYFVKAGADGAFEVPGLLDRSYTLRALDPGTGLFGDSAPAYGGGYVEITIVRDEVWPELRGRVVSLAGKPIGGITIAQRVVPFRTSARVPGGRFEGTVWHEARRATTAADGTFVLRDVGRRFTEFNVQGDAIVPTSVPAKAVQDAANFLIEVEARCHCEVALLDPTEADQVACVDADGEPIDLAILRNNSSTFETELPLHAGRSGLFVVGERAAKLLLQKNGQLVREIAITPDPGRTTTVQ